MKTGRPPKPINWEVVERRIEAGNSAATIANSFNINISNFYDRFLKQFGVSFATFAQKAPETRDNNIEYTQYMKALSGNVQMLTWLGKVWCGQREPDMLSATPANQEDIDKSQRIMELEHKLSKYESNGNQSQTE